MSPLRRSSASRERAHPIHYAIGALLIVNLGLTAWVLVRQGRSATALVAAAPALPAELTDEVRAGLFARVQARYNARDAAGLYALFDASARAQISEADFTAQFQKLTELFGSIQSGAYSHHELASSQGDRSVFKLYYDVKLTSPRFSQGQATLIIMSKGSDVALVGFQLNSGLK